MNIREIIGFNNDYHTINREERNYSAILYLLLCKPGNLERFLNRCGIEFIPDEESSIYFEYAFLRDLWNTIDVESIKLDVIRKKLLIPDLDHILSGSYSEINSTFGVPGNPSSQYIQFPGNWSLGKFHQNFPNAHDLLKICKFKWSFNIKPDIVIHLGNNGAVCIETKYESKEGSYPTNDFEKKIFREMSLQFVGQTELQQYMMNELLGFDTKFLYISCKENVSNSYHSLLWKDAFNVLDQSDLPDFIRSMIMNISK